MSKPGVLFSSGKIRVRVRWDAWDAEYHCRILRPHYLHGEEKIGEEHVHAAADATIGSTFSTLLAASTALERAVASGYVKRGEISWTRSQVPGVAFEVPTVLPVRKPARRRS